MADEQKAGAAAPAEKQQPEAQTYHRDRLTAEAHAFFGVQPHVVAGALAQKGYANKVNFTRDDVQQAIKTFLDHEVEIDHGQEG